MKEFAKRLVNEEKGSVVPFAVAVGVAVIGLNMLYQLKNGKRIGEEQDRARNSESGNDVGIDQERLLKGGMGSDGPK